MDLNFLKQVTLKQLQAVAEPTREKFVYPQTSWYFSSFVANSIIDPFENYIDDNITNKDTLFPNIFGRFVPIQPVKMSLIRVVFLLGTLFLAWNTLASETIVISGIVTDHNGSPLDLTTVRVLQNNKTTITDNKGRFQFTILKQDTLSIQFECLTFLPLKQVFIHQNKDIQIHAVLLQKAKTINEFTIKGIKEMPASFEKVDATKVRLLPDPSGGSIEALLTTFPGVSTNHEMSAQYSVRGGNFDENLVYVNGVEIYRPLLIRAGQQEGMSFVNPELVKEVHFSAGGFESKYGDKMSSVLDIVYKKPKQFESVVNASLLGTNIYLGQSSKNGKFSQIHGFRYKSNAYLLKTLDTDAAYKPNFMDYQTQLSYQMNPVFEWTILGNFSRNTYHFSPSSSETVFGTSNQLFTMSVDFKGKEKDAFNTIFSAILLNINKQTTNSHTLKASFFETKENEDYDITGTYWLSETPPEKQQPERINEFLLGSGMYHEHARNYLIARVSNVGYTSSIQLFNHHIESGISHQLEQIQDQIKEWKILDSAGYSLPYIKSSPSLSYALKSKVSLKTHRFQAYIQDHYRFRTEQGMFGITFGLRSQFWSFNREWLLSPRISATYKPTIEKDIQYRISGGVYYQAPFYKELRDTDTSNGLTEVILNHHIKAQKSIQLVGSVDYRFTALNRPFKLTTELYHKKLSNINPYTVDNVRIRYSGKNSTSGYTNGLDFKLYGELLPGKDSWLSLSLLQSKEKSGTRTVSRPNESRYNISMFFQDYFPNNPKVIMNLKVIWADGLPVYSFRLPSYRRIDIGLSKILVQKKNHMPNIWVGLDCFNLLNIRNTNSYYWIKDLSNNQRGIPNYLTGRLLNVKGTIEW